MRTSLRRGVGTAIIVVLILISVSHRAIAHAGLVRSQPAVDAAIQSPPGIDLWFNELLEDGFNSVVVTPSTNSANAAGVPGNLVREKPAVDPHDQTHLFAKLAPLPPGEYLVQWRVLSRDGHSAPGQFHFRVLGVGANQAKQ